MSASDLFEFLGPELLANLRAAVGGDPLHLSPDCDHHPIPCAWVSDNDHSCKINKLCQAWRARDSTYPEGTHPLVQALQSAGCNPLRARMVLAMEGYGMQPQTSTSLINAYKRHEAMKIKTVSKNIKVCDQCRPGTNTYALQGSSYDDGCFFLPVSVAENSGIAQSGKVLCIGAGGELKWCGKDEFMAVSHVWDHGWQGDSEKGICTRVLDMLLTIANLFGLEYVWLDIAMISNVKEVRVMSINSMNLVYSTAKVTVVCDRLLISMAGGSDHERCMAICLCDWMTRVWTMQEAILSQDLVFIFGDCQINGGELLSALIGSAIQPDLHWQQYGAILTLHGMVSALTAPMLDRVRSLARERLTTKSKDLVRAVFPLFKAEWPNPDITMEQGQEVLLRHLGQEGGRLASLHGPIMPKPWSWAPLSIAGTSGAMPNPGSQMFVTPDGLHGRWASWKVTVIGKEPDDSPYVNPNGFGKQLARLTDCCYDFIFFQVEGVDGRFNAHVFSRKENTYPWPNRRLILFRGNNTGSARTLELDYYHLVLRFKQPHSSGLPIFHRVGSIEGSMTPNSSGLLGLAVDPSSNIEGYMV